MIKAIKHIVAYSIIPLLVSEFFFLMLGIVVHSFVVTPIILLMDLLGIFLIVTSFHKNNTGLKLFFIWFFFNLLTICSYLNNDLPYSCFGEMLRPYIFPMLFFMLGIDNDIDSTKFFNVYLYTYLFVFILGIILYVTMPSFYLSYLSELASQAWYGTNSSESYILENTRMSAFFDSSYAISYSSIPAMSIALGGTFNSNAGKTRWLFVVTIICWLSALLCQQRSAMFFSVVVVVYYFYKSRRIVKGKSFFMGFIIAGILGIIFFLSATDRFDLIKDAVETRFNEMSLSEAYEGSREYQVETTVRSINNYIVGDGLGARSAPARKLGRVGVTDNEYIRILAESGIVGIVLFFVFAGCSLLKARRRITVYFAEIMVIGFFIFAMIGSNSLSISHLYAPIFWFSMGSIWKRQYNNNLNEICLK